MRNLKGFDAFITAAVFNQIFMRSNFSAVRVSFNSNCFLLSTVAVSHQCLVGNRNGVRPIDKLTTAVCRCDPLKVKVHTLDIAPLLSESPLQKRSGMARVLKGFHSFTCTPTRSSAIGMSHTCLCLPSSSWYSFTDPGGMEG